MSKEIRDWAERFVATAFGNTEGLSEAAQLEALRAVATRMKIALEADKAEVRIIPLNPTQRFFSDSDDFSRVRISRELNNCWIDCWDAVSDEDFRQKKPPVLPSERGTCNLLTDALCQEYVDGLALINSKYPSRDEQIDMSDELRQEILGKMRIELPETEEA